MKKNVLVFPCGSEIGLEIYRSLSLSTHFNLFGGSSVDDHGKFVYKNYIQGIPNVDHEDFTQTINKIIDTHKIDFIFPAHDSVVLKLAQERSKGVLNAEVITSSLQTCELARSKNKTYKYYRDIVATPKVYSNIESISETDFPLFLKPDVGQGSKGTYLVKSMDEAEFYLRSDPTLLILEYLPGTEYTVDCFTNSKGILLYCEGRERKRVSNGISVSSSTTKDGRFKDFAEIINQSTTLKGAWFFQVKENTDGVLVLMEIAPRIAGTMALARCKGVNLALLSLFDVLGYDIHIFDNDYEMMIDRALENRYRHDIEYSHVYLDLDDTLIFEDKVNIGIIAFVFQCFNKGIKVHLITRHKAELDHTLIEYKLYNMFDELIWIKDESPKHLYVAEPKSIFIDDSFSERESVYSKLKIPVFDTHMIEGLMEIS